MKKITIIPYLMNSNTKNVYFSSFSLSTRFLLFHFLNWVNSVKSTPTTSVPLRELEGILSRKPLKLRLEFLAAMKMIWMMKTWKLFVALPESSICNLCLLQVKQKVSLRILPTNAQDGLFS